MGFNSGFKGLKSPLHGGVCRFTPRVKMVGWTFWRKKKLFSLSGIESRFLCCTDHRIQHYMALTMVYNSMTQFFLTLSIVYKKFRRWTKIQNRRLCQWDHSIITIPVRTLEVNVGNKSTGLRLLFVCTCVSACETKLLLQLISSGKVHTLRRFFTTTAAEQINEFRPCVYYHNFQQNLLHEITQIQGIHKRMVLFQKLTRNLFLTLHGHNVYRQQRQLSMFLMRYQQFASHA